jgi:hypothetical protein
MKNTRKNVPWRNWSKKSPGFRERKIMSKKCGRKCFLGPNTSFPICNKNTCKVNPKGVYAAYVRSRQYRKSNKKYYKISKKASDMLKKMGVKK